MKGLIEKKNALLKILRGASESLSEDYSWDKYAKAVLDVQNFLSRLIRDRTSVRHGMALVLGVAARIPLYTGEKESFEWRLLKDGARSLVGEF